METLRALRSSMGRTRELQGVLSALHDGGMSSLIGARTAGRSGISTGRERPIAPVPEPVLHFRD